MAIPKHNEMYRPFLICLKDGQPHKINEVKEIVAKVMGVTEEERKELLPTRKQSLFDNRLGWTAAYLKKAGLIDSPSRAVYSITSEGRKLLKENPPIINDALLMRYDNFRLFKHPNGDEKTIDIPILLEEETPQDILDSAFKMINSSLADGLLTEIMKQSSSFFEILVVDLLIKMGYGGSNDNAGSVLGKSGDEGIDGTIREDKLGFSSIYIQAKRWDINNAIGRPEINKFVGALVGQGATKGLFITTARFTKEALSYANMQHAAKLILVDGIMLANLMIEYDIGVSLENNYRVKRMDTDYFSDENV